MAVRAFGWALMKLLSLVVLLSAFLPSLETKSESDDVCISYDGTLSLSFILFLFIPNKGATFSVQFSDFSAAL